MRTLIACAAATFALAACQREEPADPVAEAPPAAADAAVDAAASSPARPTTSAPSASEDRPTAVPADGSSDTLGAQPAAEGMMSGPSPEVRDAAKEKAEETNLHPRT